MMLATEPIGLRAVAKSALARVVRNTQPRVASRRLSSTPGAVNLRQTQYPQVAESYKVPRVRIDLQPYRCRCGQSSTWVKAGVVEHAHYVSVEPHGVEVTFNPDLVIVPLTNRARSLLGQRFLIGSVVFAIDGSRAVNVRAVWCPQLVDLHLEAEIVGHEGRVVVALRLRTGKADLDPRVRVLREPHPLQAQHEVGRGGLCAPKNTHVGSCYRFQGPVDHSHRSRVVATRLIADGCHPPKRRVESVRGSAMETSTRRTPNSSVSCGPGSSTTLFPEFCGCISPIPLMVIKTCESLAFRCASYVSMSGSS